MVVHPKTLWVAYGPTDGALVPQESAVLRGLQGRPELNGKHVQILNWDGIAGRFAVKIEDQGQGEKIKVKAVNLQPRSNCIDLGICVSSESHLGALDSSLDVAVALFLRSRCVAALSGVSRALRASLWLRKDAEQLWQVLLVRRYGSLAAEVPGKVRSMLSGPLLFRGARNLRNVFRETVELVRGGVDAQSQGFEVVACPVVRSLILGGFGAQYAVRKAAGHRCAVAIEALAKPVEQQSVTLVDGGDLAQRVALVVTEPPDYISQHSGSREEIVLSLITWLTVLHQTLLNEVRNAGFRTVAMPVLATGGIRMPPHMVAIAAMEAAHSDFIAHPADPLRIRVACFEGEHMLTFDAIKSEILDNFYRPSEVMDLLRSSLVDIVGEG